MERGIYNRDPSILLDVGGLVLYSISDPAGDAAVTAAIIDGYDGVLITLTGAGNAQTIASPTDTVTTRRFTVINNDTSTHPITVNGNAIQDGESQTWIWDGSAWCSVAYGAWTGALYTTKLTVTAEIAASTNFSTTAGGVGYTHSGDAGILLASAALFNAAEYVEVFLNGVRLTKAVEATWQSSSSFQLNTIVDSGDIITILS